MMDSLRKQIIETARSYKGVAFKHTGRTRDGMDCAGLIICVAHDLKLSDFDIRAYSVTPDKITMGEILREQMVPVARQEMTYGDVVWLASHDYCHLAILGDGAVPFSMIHAFSKVKRVTENRLDTTLMRRVAGQFAFPGVIR